MCLGTMPLLWWFLFCGLQFVVFLFILSMDDGWGMGEIFMSYFYQSNMKGEKVGKRLHIQL